MVHQRWLRIIPVALIMYTISYVDRTNISLALDPKISSMMRDLMMDDRMKGQAAGIFFLGYVLLQIPGGYLAGHWSAKKLITLCLVFWGICAVGCGLVSSFREFAVMRFLLGVAESGVFPTMLVLLAHWFPRAERARANAFWNLCQPLAVAASAPVTGWLLGALWLADHADPGRRPAVHLAAGLVVFHQRPSARREMDFERGKEFSGNHVATRSRGTGAGKKDLPRARLPATGGVRHADGLFSPQLRGLWLHDVFHGRA